VSGLARRIRGKGLPGPITLTLDACGVSTSPALRE